MPPCLSLTESFVFHEYKTWKWLRKMEPPNGHCLRWEWVSQKQIGVGEGSTAAACLMGVCRGSGAAAWGREAEKMVVFAHSAGPVHVSTACGALGWTGLWWGTRSRPLPSRA